jgi:hypothetical protein
MKSQALMCDTLPLNAMSTTSPKPYIWKIQQYLHGMVDVIRGSECTNTVDNCIVQYWDQEHGVMTTNKQDNSEILLTPF